MTAHSGSGWRLAPSLIALEREANRLAPRRSQASDGSIGDQSHQNRSSDHNPKWGWVHALDLTHDPRGGFDAHAHARGVAARRDSRIDYIISDGRIWNAYAGWRNYGGVNPHRTHAHFSIHKSAWARNNTAPWLSGSPVTPGPNPVPTSKPSTMPTEEEDDVTVLVRNDPAQGGNGAVIAVSGRFFTHVKDSEDYEFLQFITGGPDAVRQVSSKNFARFLSTHVDAQNVNVAALYAKSAATK